jgi:hypothetical protein
MSKRLPFLASASAETVSVEYGYGIPSNFTLIGSSTSQPLFKFTWQPPGPARAYFVYCRSVDGDGDFTDSPSVRVQVDSNTPTVTLTYPTHQATFTYNPAVPASNTITLTASVVKDAGVPISSVRFYVHGVLVGEDSSSPYSCPWTFPGTGGFVITTMAIEGDLDEDPNNDPDPTYPPRTTSPSNDLAGASSGGEESRAAA